MLIKGMDVGKSIIKDIESLMGRLGNVKPTLTIIRVGDKPEDIFYQKNAMKKLLSLGIECRAEVFKRDISQEEFEDKFNIINRDNNIHGILIMKPLPEQLDDSRISEIIDPNKDVDGISPRNIAGIYFGNDKNFSPCTPQAVIEILDYIGCNLKGKKVTVVGCGNVVGKPLTLRMFIRGATVTVCNRFTKNLIENCKYSDILIAAAGQRNLIGKEHVSEDTVVIDVGTNFDENGKMHGDVDFENVVDKVKAITPVPMGVGTVTQYVLAKHVVEAALKVLKK